MEEFELKTKELQTLLEKLKPATYDMRNLPKNESKKPGLIVSTKLMFKDWFTTNKRMGLADFWWGYAGLWLITLFVCFILGALLYFVPASNLNLILRVVIFLGSLWAIIFYFITLTALIRRYHDAELPTFLCFLLFVPILGELISLLLAMRPQKKDLGWHNFENPFKKRR